LESIRWWPTSAALNGRIFIDFIPTKQKIGEASSERIMMFPLPRRFPGVSVLVSGRQNISFSPNWICLGGVFTFSELI
jgi:hypothetical protein